MKKLITTTALALALGGASLAFAAPPDGPRHGHERGMMQEEFLKGLPPEKAAMVKESMDKQREAGKATHEQMKKLRDEQKAILTADKFDRAAFLAKAKQIGELSAKRSAARAESIADVAAKLTPQERTMLAERFEKRRFHRPPPPPPGDEMPEPPEQD